MGVVTDPTSSAPPRIRPSGWWYALPAALVVAGVIAGILLWAAAFDRFSDVARSSDGGVISVNDDEKLSVFADLPATETLALDDLGGAGACSLTPVGGGDPVLTMAFNSSITFDEGNRHWVRVGVVPSGTAAGDYELACGDLPATDLAVASTDGIRDGALLAVAGVGVPIIATLAALVALIVLIVLRSRSKGHIQAAAYPGGYAAPYRTYGHQPGYGHQPYGQQAPYGQSPSGGGQTPPYGQPPGQQPPPYGQTPPGQQPPGH